METKVHIFDYDNPDNFMEKYFMLTEYMEKAVRGNLIYQYECNMYFGQQVFILEFIIWTN